MSWWTSQRLHPKIKSKFLVVFGDCFYIPSVKSVNKPKVEFDTKEYRLINHVFNYPGNAKWQPVTIKFIDMNGDVNPSNRHEFFDTSSFLWQIMNNTGYRYPYHNVSHYRENHYRKEGQTTGTSTGHWIATKIDDEKGGGWRTITTPEKSSTISNSFGLGLSGVPDFKSASTVKQRVSIYQIDPEGYTVELWHLVNPIVKSVGWGDLAYDSEELVEYELQIVYDWAILDRKALGKKPNICVEKFTDFMKTIYITNEIDLDDDLENKIEKFKKRDKELDAQRENAMKTLKELQDSDYQDNDGLIELRDSLDNIETERLKLETSFDDLLVNELAQNEDLVGSLNTISNDLLEETNLNNDISRSGELVEEVSSLIDAGNFTDFTGGEEPQYPSPPPATNYGGVDGAKDTQAGSGGLAASGGGFGGGGTAEGIGPIFQSREEEQDEYLPSEGNWPITTESPDQVPKEPSDTGVEFREETFVNPNYTIEDYDRRSGQQSPPPPPSEIKTESQQADWDPTFKTENWTEEQQQQYQSDINETE